MKRYGLSPRARVDLQDIWIYTAEHWNAEQADRYIGEIQDAMALLVEHAHLGAKCDDLRKGYFKRPVASHVLFYRVAPDGIDVIRALHHATDFTRRF